MNRFKVNINNGFLSKKKVIWLKSLMLLVIPVIVLLRLFYLQIWQYETQLPKIESQLFSKLNINIPRGDILDCNNKILATTLEYEKVAVNTKEFFEGCKKRKDNLTLVCETLNLDIEEFLSRSKKEKYFVLKKDVPTNITYKIKKVRGLDFEKYTKRIYPQKTLCSYVIGRTNYNEKEKLYYGYSGIEKEYNDLLSDVNIKEVKVYRNGSINNVSIRLTNLKDVEEIENKNRNFSLVLTINSKIQYIVEKIINKYYQEYFPQNIICIIQNPETAEIIAMAISPETNHPMMNPAVNMVFEPGSTFKIFPVAIFLDEKVMTKDTVFNCENGKYIYCNHEISDLHPYNKLTLTDIIVYSSNIGMSKAYLSYKNHDKFCYYLKLYGFGTITGVDLPGEIKGKLITPKNFTWSDYQPVAMSFGQGLSVTALQMVNAYTMIANGGKLLQPYIVKYVIDGNNKIIHETTKRIIREPISTETTEIIKDMLEETVLRGTARKTKIDGVRICAKTGTAQKYQKDLGKYSDDKNVMSVCGFFPREKPKYVIGIFVDEPKKGKQASEVAVPIFKDIIVELLNYTEEIKYAKAD